ncbi:hypothetical protein [Tuwongella immobilis]|uniref:Uncharacterized protein n=1 Tax=Tuwongella immobilis TaxID=692036 RepID=A0A6C2YS81_9BACT|nr:hypothetical protein [Tuwongella immobilis]VIP03732.1 Uncharacterized protein OS=uncultured bacterium PE=4 SV=1 [Tuwongella immobilis]VTS04832.1 Uncharacterized protein OS=uncultured bacterium PE=4 SV=1 [Tuwongella immobilis]
MDEQQWFAETDPEPMLAFVRNRIGLRKLRLFVCACWRRVLSLLDEQAATALYATEQSAENGIIIEGEAHDLFRDASDVTDQFAWSMAFNPSNTTVDGGKSYEIERAAQCQLLRDIVGNPFRPVAIYPILITPEIAQIAQIAYQERTFPTGTLYAPRLAALADALETTGCTDAEILTHCRNAETHVRGCWVIDWVMGKS